MYAASFFLVFNLHSVSTIQRAFQKVEESTRLVRYSLVGVQNGLL